MSTGHPNYQSLSVQVARRIKSEITQGTWVGWLPGERLLADRLQVSRKTLRKALAELAYEGVLVTAGGMGHRIRSDQRRNRTRPANQVVGLVSQEPLQNLRPYTLLWIDELRAMLFNEGIRLTEHPNLRVFSSRPQKAIRQLVEQNPQSCWVLVQSNEQMQRWFADAGIACVIAGSCHQGLRLPSVDWDYFASCRHAALAMLRRGHRRIAFLTRESQRAGDLESEAGFIQGGQSVPDARTEIVRHDGTVEDLRRKLGRLLDHRQGATALLIANPKYYLTVTSFLAERGLQVPRDVSLVSRDDEAFLSFLTPEPTRYSFNPRAYAKHLLNRLIPMLHGRAPSTPIQLLEPKALAGLSLGLGPTLKSPAGAPR